MLIMLSLTPMMAPKWGESLYRAAVMALALVSTAAQATPAARRPHHTVCRCLPPHLDRQIGWLYCLDKVVIRRS